MPSSRPQRRRPAAAAVAAVAAAATSPSSSTTSSASFSALGLLPLFAALLALLPHPAAAVVLCDARPGGAAARAACAAEYGAIEAATRASLRATLAANPAAGPRLVRLAWASAATYDGRLSPAGGTAGGCVKQTPQNADPANVGLAPAVKDVYALLSEHPTVTFADMTQLAAAVAHELMGSAAMSFTPGRSDVHPMQAAARCAPAGRQPSPDSTTGAALLDRLAFYLGGGVRGDGGRYPEEAVSAAVALLGGHTLGGVQGSGVFTQTPFAFNNEYFTQLAAGGSWGPPVPRAAGEGFVHKRGASTLLPMDVSVALDDQMKEHAAHFAGNNTLFLEEYARAWTTVVENGVDFSAGLDGGVDGGGDGTAGPSGCTRSSLPIRSRPGTLYDCTAALPLAGTALHWTTEKREGEAEVVVHVAVTNTWAGWFGVSFPGELDKMLSPLAFVHASDTGLRSFEIVQRNRAGLLSARATGGVSTATHEVVDGRQILSFSWAGPEGGTAVFDPHGAILAVARSAAPGPLGKHDEVQSVRVAFLDARRVGVAEHSVDGDTLLAWRRAHGYLAAVAVFFLLPAAALTRRYGRRVFGVSDTAPSAAQRGVPVGPAFHLHAALALAGVASLAASAAIGYAKLGGRAAEAPGGGDRYGHRAVAAVVLSLLAFSTLLGAASGLARPMRSAAASVAAGWVRWAHTVAGVALVFAGVFQCASGLSLYRKRVAGDGPMLSSVSIGCAFIITATLMLEAAARMVRRRRRLGSRRDKRYDGAVVYTMDEVAQHAAQEDPWVVIDGRVFDVSSWLSRHPGGADVLLLAAGTDATEGFLKAEHSEAALKRLDDGFLGRVQAAEISAISDLVGEVAEYLCVLDTAAAMRAIATTADQHVVPRTLALELQDLVRVLSDFKASCLQAPQERVQAALHRATACGDGELASVMGTPQGPPGFHTPTGASGVMRSGSLSGQLRRSNTSSFSRSLTRSESSAKSVLSSDGSTPVSSTGSWKRKMISSGDAQSKRVVVLVVRPTPPASGNGSYDDGVESTTGGTEIDALADSGNANPPAAGLHEQFLQSVAFYADSARGSIHRVLEDSAVVTWGACTDGHTPIARLATKAVRTGATLVRKGYHSGVHSGSALCCFHTKAFHAMGGVVQECDGLSQVARASHAPCVVSRTVFDAAGTWGSYFIHTAFFDVVSLSGRNHSIQTRVVLSSKDLSGGKEWMYELTERRDMEKTEATVMNVLHALFDKHDVEEARKGTSLLINKEEQAAGIAGTFPLFALWLHKVVHNIQCVPTLEVSLAGTVFASTTEALSEYQDLCLEEKAIEYSFKTLTTQP